MIINPIKFNLFSNISMTHIKPIQVSFCGKLIDTYEADKATQNSAGMIKGLREGDYAGVREFLQLANEDFDPNYHDRDDLSLIGALYRPSKRLSPVQKRDFNRYKGEILARIFEHPKFDPNYCYKEPDTGKDVFYIQDAVKFNDAYLALLLNRHPDGIADPYFDDFETLMISCKSPSVNYLISQCALCILGAKTPASLEALADNKEFYESNSVKQYRAYISDRIPKSLDEVGGMDDVKEVVNDFIIKPWSKDIRQQLKENNIEMPNGFLMYGPPGCGKTYIAKVIANQTGFPMYEVDLSNVGNCKAYQTANTLRMIFTELESQYKKNGIPNILFLDEIDSIAASRSDSKTDWKRDDVNALITQLNNAAERGIIVVGATNMVDNVDDAILRPGRFDKKIEVRLPDEKQRKDIIEKISVNKKIAVDIYNMADELAKITEGKSPSDLNAIINDCCRRAIYAHKSTITKDDFMFSIIQVENAAKNKQRPIGFSAIA